MYSKSSGFRQDDNHSKTRRLLLDILPTYPWNPRWRLQYSGYEP